MRPPRRPTWLATGLAGALLLSACVGSSDDDLAGGGDPTAAPAPAPGELSVALSANRTVVGAGERLVVSMTMTNAAAHPVALPAWFAPGAELEEDLFAVTVDGAPVAYVGPHYKRPAPEAADLVVLPAGGSITRDVDLTDFYDLSRTGAYQVAYAAAVGLAAARVEVRSQAIALQVAGRPSTLVAPQGAKGTAPGLTSAVTFSKCTTAQQADVQAGLGAASTMANGAATYLGGAASATQRYTTWFGTFSSTGWSTAQAHFAAIKDVFDTRAINFDCSCKKRYYAYVYPNQPYNIYLCSAYWTAPVTGTDSKGGTIVHETSHFGVVASTDDWAYGQSAAKSLAISDPAKALDNADSHEYFAENTPALP